MRLGLCALINSGLGTLQILLVPVVLAAGGGLVGAVWAIAGTACATTLAHGVVAFRTQPRLWPPRFPKGLVKRLVRFGGALAVSTAVAVAVTYGEKLILTHFGSVSDLAYYTVALTLGGVIVMAPIAVSQALMPAFARLQDKSRRPELRELYERITRIVLLGTLPASLLLAGVAKPFLELWAGPEYARRSAPLLYILVGGFSLNALALIPYRLLTALGRADLNARYHLAELVPYLAGATALVYYFGTTGAALAWSLRLAAGMVWCFFIVWRITGMLPNPLPAATRSFAAALLALAIPLAAAELGGAPAVVRLGLCVAAAAVYATMTWSSVLTAGERAWVTGLVRAR
jgi:O-antigen/teichoic acid export membrane protein